ncbi:helix-turn-helix domain-containing protein [Streptomyces sp. NPDC004647]|uniref:PucR family transcriptional regulator n=1 Tax=Streptomyces sp. NPDC004647 TaxID=3154671 RepID=UPI0033BDA0E3
MRGDYQQLVDEISAVLGAPATLEDRDFGLIAFGAHDSEGDDGEPAMDPVRTRSILHRRSTAAVRAWFEAFGIARATGPVRIPPDPAAGVLMGRICLPVRHRGIVHGYVWLLDDGHLSVLETGGAGVPPDPRLAQAMDTASRIGGLLAAEARAGAEVGELLRDLLTGPPAGRDAAAADLRHALGATADGPLTLVAVTPWLSETDDRAVAEGPGSALAGQPGVAAMCVLPTESAGADAVAALVRLRAMAVLEPALTAAQRLLRSPRAGAGSGPPGAPAAGRAATEARAAGPSGATAGISSPRRDLYELPAAWPEAVAAARAARADAGLGPVAEWPAIGPYRMLTGLPAGAPDSAVAPLLEPQRAGLAHTAEVFLDCAGQAGRAAAALAIHRQTLYYRLSRVEKLTGLDLDEGEDRLLLHMALKAARLRAPAAAADH